MATQKHSKKDNDIERHVRKKAMRILAVYIGLPALAFVFWLVWMASDYNGLSSREAMDIAQVAEHIVNGDGFSTSVLRPLSLGIVPDVDPHPDLLHAPFFLLLESMLFVVGGVQDRMAAFASGIGWLLCVWLTYMMGRVLLKTRKAAFLCCILILLNVPLLNLSVSGTPETWTTAFLTAALLFIAIAAGKMQEAQQLKEQAGGAAIKFPLPWKYCAASGLFVGLMVMTDYSLAIPAVVSLFLYWLNWVRKAGVRVGGQRQRSISSGSTTKVSKYGIRLAGLFLLLVTLMSIPWMIRNMLVTGNPLFSLSSFTLMQGETGFVGDMIWRTQEESIAPLIFLLLKFPAIIGASLRALPPLPMVLARLFNPVTLVLFIVGLFIPRFEQQRIMNRVVAAIFIWSVVVFSVLSKEIIDLIALAPTISVLATASLLYICRDRGNRLKTSEYWKRGRGRWLIWIRYFLYAHRHILLGAFLFLLAAAPFLGNRVNQRIQPPLRLPLGVEQLADLSTANDLVLTDSPWAVAWWGKRKAVWLPQQQNAMDEWMKSESLRPNWIYLRGFPGMTRQEFAAWWVEMIRQPNERWMGFSANLSENPRVIIRTRIRE